MVKPHKLARSSVRISTTLEPTRVMEVSSELAARVKHVRFEGSSEGVAHFSIHDRFPRSFETMAFDLAVAENGAVTTAVTAVCRHHTRSRAVLGIPAGKELLGYKVYRRFMDELAGAVRLADLTSTATITERPQASH